MKERRNQEEEKIGEVQLHEAAFQGVDENMELDKDDQEELMKFETVQTSKEIEFDKIKISDV